MHQTQGVPHSLRAQHALTRDWAGTAVSQGGCHDTGALTGHLNGAQLEFHIEEVFLSVHRITFLYQDFLPLGTTCLGRWNHSSGGT